VDLIQWPAMLVTVVAAWLIASSQKRRRNVGFWLFLASNVLWIVWAWGAHAYALIVLQVCLGGMNIRGAKKTADETDMPPSTKSTGQTGVPLQ